MIVVIMYASYGINVKSHIGVISCIIGVLIVGLLAKLFINLTNINGSGSEEAFLLLAKLVEI